MTSPLVLSHYRAPHEWPCCRASMKSFNEVKTVPRNTAAKAPIILKTNEQHAEDLFANEEQHNDAQSQQSENSDHEEKMPPMCAVM